MKEKEFIGNAHILVHNKKASNCIYFDWSFDPKTNCRVDEKEKSCCLFCGDNCQKFECSR